MPRGLPMITADAIYNTMPPPGFVSGSVELSAVLITDELQRRNCRAPDHAVEAKALLALTDSLNAEPRQILQALTDKALALTGAHSAGISLLEEDEDGCKIFRWHAITGELQRYLGGTMPRYFSPCGLVIDGNATLLMRMPVLFFPYIAQLHMPVIEVLLVPFSRNGMTIGTVWIVSHDEEKCFDDEDRRLTASIARFCAAAVTVRDNLLALERTRDRLQIEEKRRTDFLATLAHELRNPLAVLRNGLELSRFDDSESFADIRLLMDRQLRHLVRMTDDLFDTACINNGKLKLNRSIVDVRSAVDAAIEICLPLIENARHRLLIDRPSAAMYVDADPTRLTQVFANLLNNAVKYTPAEGVIELRIEAVADDVVVSVSDNGLGIAAEMQSTIFEMYSQEARTQGRANHGLGVGLPLVKKLVELHGGAISVESAGPNRGSIFSVRLPRAAAP